jgi:hypothetical protein
VADQYILLVKPAGVEVASKYFATNSSLVGRRQSDEEAFDRARQVEEAVFQSVVVALGVSASFQITSAKEIFVFNKKEPEKNTNPKNRYNDKNLIFFMIQITYHIIS